jgi:Protein kinase domain
VTAARSVSGIFTAPVVDADPDGQLPWLATAYVPGPSLTDAVAERGPLPPGVVLTLAAGLAEALVAIHAAGLVHRDLKPSNVLLAQDGPRVIDFGISRAADASVLTQTGAIMGSPGYLSPEQAEGRQVGPPGDVFSLGAVLAFAASGAGPFGTGPAVAIAFRVVNAAPNLSGVPERLRPLIERCLVKDPAARPSPGELLASLTAGHAEPQWLSPPLADGAESAAGPATYAQPAGEATPVRGPALPTGPIAEPPAPNRRAARRGRPGLAVTAVAVLAVAAAGIALAVTRQGSDPPARSAGSGAVSSPAQTAPSRPEVDGVWTGTYDCNQGLTGVQLTITGSTGGALKATVDFYPVASNPGVAKGSYELVGSYSAAQGLVLNPDYWISEPAGYEMVGLSAPSPHANLMNGSVQGLNCSTFSVTR